MPYSTEINRNNPTCFLFVIDQSGSMDEEMDGGAIKSHFVADVLNKTLAETIVRCTKADGIRDYFDIGVIGYGGACRLRLQWAAWQQDPAPDLRNRTQSASRRGTSRG